MDTLEIPGLTTHSFADRDAFQAYYEAIPTCTCGVALPRIGHASGVSGAMPGNRMWAARRADLGAPFEDRPPRHDVVSRQWYPPNFGDPYKVYERRYAGHAAQVKEIS